MNYYDILEVSSKASQEVIRAAYKSLMQRYHPDRNPGDAEAERHSVRVVEAYEVLSDPDRRATYDRELTLRTVDASNVQERVRNIMASAAAVSRDEPESENRWWLWLAIVLVVLVAWFVWSLPGKRQIEDAEPKVLGGLFGAQQTDPPQNNASDRTVSATARTIPVFRKDLNVTLKAPPGAPVTPFSSDSYVLSIQTLGIVAGTFDPDKFISFLESNKEYIGQKLAEKLADANYGRLTRPDGDQYLKRFILDALGEITNTNRFEAYPLPGSDAPAHYGAVDVLLPDSFTVQVPRPEKTAPEVSKEPGSN